MDELVVAAERKEFQSAFDQQREARATWLTQGHSIAVKI